MKVLSLVLIVACVALGARAAEIIQDFHSRIDIATNAEMTVTETIRVVAEGDQIKRGIYRDFPNLYRNRWGFRTRTGFRVTGVQRDGHAEPWHTEARENGVRVYIGDANTFVNQGEHTYELSYETDRQLGFFADHDELYWNVTGNGWVFPIQHASAEVHLPDGIEITGREAYTGPQGSTQRNYTTGAEAGATQIATFETTKPLNRHEGLTIVVTWPKNRIHAAVHANDPWLIARANPGVALGLAGLVAVLFYYVLVWAAFGRDPARGVIVPLFEPPAGFSPAAVRELTRMAYDRKAFAANLIQLAVKGVLKISKNGDTFTLTNTGASRNRLLPDEAALHDKLLARGGKLNLTQSNHAVVAAAEKALKLRLAAALEKTYFVTNLRYWLTGLCFTLVPLAVSVSDAEDLAGTLFLSVWLSVWTIGVTALVSSVVFMLWKRQFIQGAFVALFALPFVAGEVFGVTQLLDCAGPWVAGLFVTGIVMNGVFYHLLKAPTKAGRLILDQIEGFKLFLTVSEKDRLNFENPPAKTPELFDRFLPYALALGVEQKWSEQFAEVLAEAGRIDSDGRFTAPWTSGMALADRDANFSGFASRLGDSLSGSIASASSPPGSSSGSSSGGGGGGSSGGGGGGGGGGGW